jgi:hypothetical protein
VREGGCPRAKIAPSEGGLKGETLGRGVRGGIELCAQRLGAATLAAAHQRTCRSSLQAKAPAKVSCASK